MTEPTDRGDPTYVAFLRAINLGKVRKFPMAELRGCLERAGFERVETHIQTGNVRLTVPRAGAGSSIGSHADLEVELERVFAATTGFDVPTMAFTPEELRSLYDAARSLDIVAERHYLTLLKNEPDEAARAEIEGWSAPGEGARVLGRAFYWWIDHPNASAQLSNARLEKLAGPATTRNLQVVGAVVGKWC